MWKLKKIPKIVHFYWGGKKMSLLRYLSFASFKKYNPDWKIYIHFPIIDYEGALTWRSSEHKISQTFDDDYFVRIFQYDDIVIESHDFEQYNFRNDVPEVFKSDYIRWHKLSTVGGLWSDFDILYINPMNNLSINNMAYQDTEVGLCQYEQGDHAIGFLMGSEDCRFWDQIKNFAIQEFDPTKYQSMGSNVLNQRFRERYMTKQAFHDINYIDPKSVYFFDSNNIGEIYKENGKIPLDKQIIGIHWYAGNAMSQKFEQGLTENNYTKFNNVVGRSIRRIIE